MRYAKGNILHTSAEVAICTVNMKGVMGAGLARDFRDEYVGLQEKYRKRLHDGFLFLGYPCIVSDKRWPNKVLLMVTKDHWKDPSQLEWITEAFDSLIARCKETGWTAHGLAVPPVGCGLGKLKWEEVVKPAIFERMDELEKIFGEVYVYG